MWRFLLALLLAVLVISGCRSANTAPSTTPPVTASEPRTTVRTADAPRRVILFIGDGMGVGQLTAATYLKGGPLEMFEMPHMAWVTTHEHEFLTTESASAATALATGRKTHYEAISVVPGTTEEEEEDPSRHMQTLHELAAEAGLGTGLVATSRIIHATPAAFVSHRHHRHQYEEIARDIADSELDVIMGAGWEAMQHEDADYWERLGERGWYRATTPEELEARPADAKRVAALFHAQNMPFLLDDEPRAMALDAMVGEAIEILDAGHPQGWVLMVEGSFPDWCGHNLDMVCAAHETLDLDRAVATARRYASDRDDTLVVVTADHETGGLTVLDPSRTDPVAEILGGEEAAAKLADLPNRGDREVPPPFQRLPIPPWDMSALDSPEAVLTVGHFSMASRALWPKESRFYGAHTPEMVPVFADGPGADAISAARDNAEIGRALRELVARGAEGDAIEVTSPRTATPKNVILVVGDGMGVSAVTATLYYRGGLAMTDLPHHGAVTTHALDGLVNDSPGSGTALSAGTRTLRHVIGLAPGADGELAPVETVVEAAERTGRATGIVTTTPLTHATAAAFFAHRAARDETAGILDDLLTLPERIEGSDGVDILFGGGRTDFDASALERLTTQGYSITDSWPPDEAQRRVVALLADDAMPRAAFRANDRSAATPTLAEMTSAAIDRLQSDDDGFFLLVEGGQIDWYQHELMRDTTVLTEVAELDDAVAVARDFAAGRDDTLVIVTADHSHSMSLLDNHYGFESGRCGVARQCGGTFEFIDIPIRHSGIRHGEGFADAALQGSYAPPRLHLQYPWPVQEAALRVDVSAPHSANLVPVFAVGPWAHRLEGWVDQPGIGELLVGWASGVPKR